MVDKGVGWWFCRVTAGGWGCVACGGAEMAGPQTVLG